MKKNRLERNNKAFSLIEVVLAIALLAIIAVPIAQAIYSSLAMNRTSRKMMAANDCGQMVMEYVTSQSYKELGPLLNGTDAFDFGTIPYQYKPANGASVSGFDDSTMTYLDLEKIYMENCTSTVAPCKIIYNSTYNGTNPEVYVLENVQYGGYHFNVGLRLEKLGASSDKYFIYKVNVDVFQCNNDDHTVLEKEDPLASFEGSIFNEFN